MLLPPHFKSALCVLAVFPLAACAGRGQQTSKDRQAQTSKETRAVATVNGREIPARLFEMYLKNGRDAAGVDESTEEGRRKLALLREGVVSELIDRELIRQEADSKANVWLPYTDAADIPLALHGYVQVAVSRGLLSAGTQFNPGAALTRAELARGIATIVRMNTQ